MLPVRGTVVTGKADDEDDEDEELEEPAPRSDEEDFVMLGERRTSSRARARNAIDGKALGCTRIESAKETLEAFGAKSGSEKVEDHLQVLCFWS